MQASQREALARTDARSPACVTQSGRDHAVLDLFVTFSIKGKSKEKKYVTFKNKAAYNPYCDCIKAIG
jgi:hypothetical protein